MSDVERFPKESLVVATEWDTKRVVRVTSDSGGKYVYMFDDALNTEVVSERANVRFATPDDAVNASVLEDRFTSLEESETSLDNVRGDEVE